MKNSGNDTQKLPVFSFEPSRFGDAILAV